MNLRKNLAVLGVAVIALCGSFNLGQAIADARRPAACPFNCDSAKHLPKLQKYLVWLQHVVADHAEALKIPMPPKPEALEVQTRSNGGSGTGDDETAGWGNGTWPFGR